ncbi:DUF342 domain-containing protein [Bacillaceae bacterium W0354]
MDFSQVFNLTVTNKKMTAYLEVNKNALEKLYTEYTIEQIKQSLSTSDIEKVLEKHKIKHGIKQELFEEIIESIDHIDQPIEIAQGTQPIKGEDGSIDYHVNATITLSIEQKGKIDFKEVMKIPKVEVGDKIATIIPPTEGKNGINVYGEEVPSKRGKEARLFPGENTKLVDEDLTIYATDSGQVSALKKKINVLPVFEVNHDLDLSIGNIDFNGSIVIRGDVPNGFSLKARGDIQVYGLVEAASLEAGGSILIKEGISGLGKGMLNAGLDIHIGNVNQGILEAGRDVLVEKSALHSHITAREVVYCKTGHIIGGTVSAGKKVVGHDIGNRLSTKTFIYLGENKKVLEDRTRIKKEIKQLLDQIKKLDLIGKNIEQVKQARPLNEKEQLMLQRQKESMKQSIHNLNELKERLERYTSIQNATETSDDQLMLTAYGVIYPNVTIICGKYSFPFQTDYKYVNVAFKENDFHIQAL